MRLFNLLYRPSLINPLEARAAVIETHCLGRREFLHRLQPSLLTAAGWSHRQELVKRDGIYRAGAAGGPGGSG